MRVKKKSGDQEIRVIEKIAGIARNRNGIAGIGKLKIWTSGNRVIGTSDLRVRLSSEMA